MARKHLVRATAAILAAVVMGAASPAVASATPAGDTAPDTTTVMVDGVATEAAGPLLLINDNSGKCLVVQGHVAGAQASQVSCTGYADQYWHFVIVGYALYMIMNANSGMCLTLSPAWGARPYQAPCNTGSPSQWWQWWASPGTTARELLRIQSNNALCVVVQGHNEWAPAFNTHCNAGYRDQLWIAA